jgi:hypothetical protein
MEKMRELSYEINEPHNDKYSEVITNFLNEILIPSEISSHFWNIELVNSLISKFSNLAISTEEKNNPSIIKNNINFYKVMVHLQKTSGIKFTKKSMNQLEIEQQKGLGSFKFVVKKLFIFIF